MINKKIRILYHDKSDRGRIEFHGDWFDMKSADKMDFNQFDFKLVSLGFSIQLPKYYELNIVPRSSTYKKFGLIQTNHFGVVDNEYCGVGDIVKFPALCLKDKSTVEKFDRICQGKIQLSQKAPWYIKILDLFTTFKFVDVDVLKGKNRGGFGSTGN